MTKKSLHKLLDDNPTMTDLSTFYQRPLLRYFMRQGVGTSDANDLVQDVFVRVISKGDIQGLENPQGYIFKIANNLLKDRRRKHRSAQEDKHQEVNEALLFCQRPLQDRVLVGQQELELVKKAILKMPKKTQRVFILNRFEKLKYREVADVLGLSVSAVEKHIMIALQRLNKLRGSL